MINEKRHIVETIEIYPRQVYGYIYLILNKINNKIYIGQSIKLNKSRMLTYFGSGKKIISAINKYGEQNFEKFFIDISYSKEELDKKEEQYIKEYKSYDRDSGYNIMIGASNYIIRTGQNNFASKTLMSREKRVKKAKKAAETRRIRNNNSKGLKGLPKERILEIVKKSHKTAKLRGTDKIRIANAVKTKIKNGTFITAAAKTSKTIKEKKLLSRNNNPMAKKYKVISPENEEFIIFGGLKYFCERYNLQKKLLLKFLDNGRVIINNKMNKFKEKSLNTIGWEINSLDSGRKVTNGKATKY